MEVIRFTKVALPFGWLGNMAPFRITYRGVRYRTSEALFQCLRFEGHPEVQAIIRAQRSPMAAKMKARKYRDLLQRQSWDEAEEDIPRMRLCLELKLQCHPKLVSQLLETGTAELIEDCTNRPREAARFWGAVEQNGVWDGRNVLGRLWMELRAERRNRPR